MKIGILGAMEQELALLRSSLSDVSYERLGHMDVCHGRLHDTDITLALSGIGKVAATIASTLLIERYQPDAIINTGSAGGFDKRLAIGDLVIADQVQHHDVDVTHFGFEPGQVFGLPKRFNCDPALVQAARQAATETLDVNVQTGLVCSGDAFIGCDTSAGHLIQQYPETCAVEMEGAAIGQTCYQLQVPFVVIRALSDIAGVDSLMSFEQYLDQASAQSASLVMALIRQLSPR